MINGRTNAERKERSTNLEAFRVYLLPKYKEILKEMTKGVYRCQGLELDLYPGPQYAYFYKTKEKISMRKALQLLDHKVLSSRAEEEEERTRRKHELYDFLFANLLGIEEEGSVDKFLNYCCGNRNKIKLVFSENIRDCLKELRNLGEL